MQTFITWNGLRILKPNSTNQTTYQYNDLGKLKQVTKPNSDVITFTYYGNIWDEEIELYWMNARHYDPETKRVSIDSIG